MAKKYNDRPLNAGEREIFEQHKREMLDEYKRDPAKVEKEFAEMMNPANMIPARVVLAELEAIHERETRKRKKA